MFQTARWRLTVSFVLALVAILIVTAVATYAITSAVVYDQVDRELRARGNSELQQIRLQPSGREPGPPRHDMDFGPKFVSGGPFYVVLSTTGDVLGGTQNIDPAAVAPTDALEVAARQSQVFVNTVSSEGESLRLYVVRVGAIQGSDVLLQVGRSIEPEKQALQRLQVVLAGSVVGGLVLALAGGYLLSGRALKPIRASVESQRSFIADASHELRTPLAVIRANAEVLERHTEEPVGANRESVADIISESDRLGRLVGQMLTLAQADANQAQISMSEVDLDDLAEQVSRGMRLLANERNVIIETDFEPLRLRADPDQLRELLLILLENAVKYTEAGGRVRIEVRHASRDLAQVRVADTGRGIPAEALPHIFDRFYRVDKARSRAAGGSGLGLSIAKWIVAAHGGTINVDSTLGVGTTVTVDMPIAEHKLPTARAL